MTDPPGASGHQNLALLDLLARRYADNPLVERGTMFRGPGLRVGGKIFAFLGHGDRLIVKVPRQRADAAVASGAAEPVIMGQRTMKEWVAFPAVADDAPATERLWLSAADEAYAYVKSLGGS
ncbi:TfoX/Sxy family protein [Arthrobacter sulfonylureivorans]|uniref:TfoX/Sxy family protein n=1 Tax=Arthrobacter sulfonylureivorans TaxID=2486855 RepID=UPI0039E5B7ED